VPDSDRNLTQRRTISSTVDELVLKNRDVFGELANKFVAIDKDGGLTRYLQLRYQRVQVGRFFQKWGFITLVKEAYADY
jgi:hypothetical protein